MVSLDQLSRKLKYRLSLPLPGLDAQLKMAHLERRLNVSRFVVPSGARIGAVLILIFEEHGILKTCFIERSQNEGVHSGQVAFPGGKKEEEETLEETVLREAEEEIGVNRNDIRLLGRLTELYIPPSNFLVQPFVGAISYRPTFLAQADEVAGIFEINLDQLGDERCHAEKKNYIEQRRDRRHALLPLAGKDRVGSDGNDYQ